MTSHDQYVPKVSPYLKPLQAAHNICYLLAVIALAAILIAGWAVIRQSAGC